jgi:alpha-L-fucosidase 2
VKYLREYFVSFPDSIIVMRITTPDSNEKITMSVDMTTKHNVLKAISSNQITFHGKLDLLSFEAQLSNRVKLVLETEAPEYPTDVLLYQHRESPYLDMLYFQYGRYLMLASSRGMDLPNNLQGIWNDNNNPPWECDIHTNINIQMNYWPAENTNLSECHLPFINYVVTEAGRENGSFRNLARSEGNRGWTVKTQSNIFAYTDWNINRPANAWYCMHLWQHYAYTEDIIYLREKVFPVLQATCEYWFDRLKEDEMGKLIAPNEWSPEQGPWEDGVAYAQ